jgi:uncharacterized membrane protein YccC
VRLRTAAWALLTAGLATASLLPAAQWLGLQLDVALLGVVIGMMATVSLQDPHPARQERTLAGVAVLASVVAVLGAALVRDFAWSASGFVIVVFAGYESRRFGPRGTALGLMAMQAYFYAMLLHPKLQDGPWLVLSVAIGCAIGWLVRFRLWPEKPAAVLGGELRAFRARLALLLHDLARRLRGGGDGDAPRTRSGLAALAALGLRIEQRVASHPDQPDAPARDALREALLHAEIAAETLASCAQAAGQAEPAARHALAGWLVRLRAALRSPAGCSADVEQQIAGLPLQQELRWRLARATDALCTQPPWALRVPAPVLTAEADIARAEHPPRNAGRPAWLRDEATRRALQASAAATGAIVAGHALSSQHWYWAVFGASIVFTRALSRGQALAQGWTGILGNAVGLAIGLGLAELAQGRTVLQGVLLFAFIGLGFYAYRAFQPVYTASLTAMLAMLYELMGMYSPGLLVLRLEESLAGALIAVLVGAFVLPVRTSEHADHESAGLARAAARALRSIFSAAPEDASEAVRDLDRRLQAARQALGPVSRTFYPGPSSGRRERLRQLARLVYCVRHLYQLVARYGELASDECLRAAAVDAAREIESAAAVLDDEAAGAGALASPSRQGARGEDSGQALRLACGWVRQVRELARALRP